MFIRAYLRASTTDQHADRAKSEFQTCANKNNVRIASFYTEYLSGTKLERAELSCLIDDSHRGDVLLIEKVDRLSRLPYDQWKELKQQLVEAGINIVVLDQPMTHAVLTHTDQQTSMI
ncbi:recombinase family protein, partial [Vibrio vulnificus]